MKYIYFPLLLICILLAPSTATGQDELDASLVEAYREQQRTTGKVWNTKRIRLPDGSKIPRNERISLDSGRWTCIEEENRMRDKYPHLSITPQIFNQSRSEDKWLPPINRVKYEAPPKYGEYQIMAPYKKPVKVKKYQENIKYTPTF
ncbi:MAG: hypothetical protein AB8F78_03325 [Saprospiraceae bacterium]